jgi:Arc/MetJ family transcription regulator
MRTNIVLDDDLMQEAIRLSGLKTKKAVISVALREYVAAKKRKNLLDLQGVVQFRDDYDYKAMRETE